MEVYVIIGVAVVILILFIIMLNSFVKLNNKVSEAFATMDVYLKKRWDLIPNLVETVKGYAKHEKETLEEVIRMRSGDYDILDDDEKIRANERITRGISRIMALAESYPKLKANENFLNLSKELTRTEDEIAQSRKYYNATVRQYNNKVQMFPSNIIAKLFGYKTKKMFEASETERNNIKVEL
jgi:LemA protein